MNILVCPNAFKGSLRASDAAQAITDGLHQSGLTGDFMELPLADGGDGSLEVVAKYLKANLMHKEVRGPLGQTVMAQYGWNSQTFTGIVELAEASGIRLLRPDQLDPWKATTYGTGQLVAHLIEQGAETIYLTVGGSATVDGGLGILEALGATFHVGVLQESQVTPADIDRLTHLDLSRLQQLDVSINILCDVDNPLLGETGAATIFGPQKGATQADVTALEKSLSYLEELVVNAGGQASAQMRHGGAAGGVAAILHGAMGATLMSGSEAILTWAGFEEALQRVDVVITGEGRIDDQTQFGKGPGLAAALAKKAGKTVIGFSGYQLPEDRGFDHFDAIFSIANGPDTLKNAMNNTVNNLERTAFQLGKLLQALEDRA